MAFPLQLKSARRSVEYGSLGSGELSARRTRRSSREIPGPRREVGSLSEGRGEKEGSVGRVSVPAPFKPGKWNAPRKREATGPLPVALNVG